MELFFVLSSFSDFFSGIPTHEYRNSNSSIYQPSVGGIFVSFCRFSGVRATGSGGAVFLSGSYSTLIEDTAFISCSSSGASGAAYLEGNYGSVMNRICGYNTEASRMTFTCIASASGYESKIQDSSISRTINGDCGIYQVALATIKFSNTSDFTVPYISTLCTVNPEQYIASYIHMVNNYASNSISVNFDYGTGTRKISFVNMIKNNSPTRYGVLYNNGYYSVEDSIFYNNSDILFYSAGGSFDIYRCYIMHDNVLYGSVTIHSSYQIITSTLEISAIPNPLCQIMDKGTFMVESTRLNQPILLLLFFSLA